jgi:phosphatidate cytidylyltransferase
MPRLPKRFFIVSNLSQRVGTGLVGAVLFVSMAYLGGIWFAALVVVIALFAQWELYGFANAVGIKPWRQIGLVGGALAVVTAYFGSVISGLTLGLLVVIAALPFTRRHDQPLTDLAVTVFGVIYPSGLLGYLVRLRLEGGSITDMDAFWLTLTVVVIIWATDTFAYAAGRTLGHHPLAPKVSPKKTWEGAIGGVLGAILLGAAFKLTVLDFLAWHHVLATAAICGTIGQLGDLAESRMKRSVNVKDSGRILPGHGGLLDRFDAFLLAVPAAYLYLSYVARVWD